MPRGLIMDFAGVLTDGAGDGLESPLVGVLRRAHRAGLRTGVLSNADRAPGPESRWNGVADVVLASGPLGVAKPDVRAYQAAADRLGLATGECVFVDDLRANVLGAVAAGMIGVRHREISRTIEELEILFDRVLSR